MQKLTYLLSADEGGIQIGRFFSANLLAHSVDINALCVFWETNLYLMDILLHFHCLMILHFVDHSDGGRPELKCHLYGNGLQQPSVQGWHCVVTQSQGRCRGGASSL